MGSLASGAESLDCSAPASVEDALEAADRVLVGLVEADAPAVERELALEVCAWWRESGGLAALHGPTAVTTALMELSRQQRPERLAARPTSEGSVLLTALRDDRVLWSIELRAERGRFVGCVVRGAPAPH